MAASEQIKSLIKSFGQGDEDRFFASAMQIAASEARQGHALFAQELKSLIEDARKNRSLSQLDRGKVINISAQKRELSELLDVFQPRITLADMVLSENIGTRLEKLINEQQKLELLLQHNLSPRRKLLLAGSPGTGKTMAAQAIAGELGIPVFIIRLDGILSKFMGESIAKLRMIFDLMPQQRAVYLFDEFDSIGSKRHQGHDVGEIKRILNSFLINIDRDNSNSIIIAATNLPEVLDTALFRRFDDILNFPLPDIADTTLAVSKYTANFSFDRKASQNELMEAAQGLNFSEIAKACEETIKEMILSNGKKLRKDILLESLKKRKQKCL